MITDICNAIPDDFKNEKYTLFPGRSNRDTRTHIGLGPSTCRQVKISFFLRYAPDCTFSSRKMKKLPTVGGGHTLPPLGRYAPSGLVASLPRKDCAPKCFGSLRHW